MDRHAAEEAD